MIAFLSVFPPYRGGISKFSDYLFKHISKRTAIKAFNFSNLYPSLLFPGKSQFINNEFEDYASRSLHSWNPLNWSKTSRSIAQLKPGHLIISYWHPFFAPAFTSVIKNIKQYSPNTNILILAHNILPHEGFPLGEALSKRLLDSSDQVIVLSEKSYKEAISLHINTDVIKLFHPVYEQVFPDEDRAELKKKYGFDEDDLVLLFFGLVRSYKGLDLLIEALNNIDLGNKNIKPFIVGEFYTEKGPILSGIRSDHKEYYSIIDRFVSDEEMGEILTLSDVMVMPYRSASQSGILANAINFKLPCIVSGLEGLTEHVVHNKTGIISPPNDIPELKKAILSATDSELRTTISNNLEVLKQELSWKAFTDAMLEKVIK